MDVEHSRARRQFTGRPGHVLPGIGNLVEASQAPGDLFRSDRARSKDPQGGAGRVEDRRLQAEGSGPAVRIRSILPSRSHRTCSARVGESRFERLAVGAASGWPTRSIRPRRSGGEGLSAPPLLQQAPVEQRQESGLTG